VGLQTPTGHFLGLEISLLGTKILGMPNFNGVGLVIDPRPGAARARPSGQNKDCYYSDNKRALNP
jgi:hypothetical protein